MNEAVRSSVYHEVDTRRVAGISHLGEVSGLPLGVNQESPIVVSRVLEIAANDPGFEESLDEFGRWHAKARLDVCRYRDRRRLSDPSRPGEDQVRIRGVIVRLSEYLGDSTTRRCKKPEPGCFYRTRRRDVPNVGQQQGLSLVMRLQQVLRLPSEYVSVTNLRHPN